MPIGNINDFIGATKFDHMDLDTVTGLLYLSAKENNSVVVIDTASNTVVTSINGIGAPQGLLVVRNPAAGTEALFVAGDNDGLLRSYTLTQPYTLSYSVDLTEGADNIRYDAVNDTLWVAYGGDTIPAGMAYIQASTGVWMGSVPFPAHPEEFQLSPVSNLMYVSCPDAGSVMLVVDRVRAAVVSSWPLLPFASEPYANALDAVNARLFVAAQANIAGDPQFLVLNAYDGSIVWSVPTTFVCDNVQYDAAAGLIYVSCGGDSITPSTLYVIQQTNADAYTLLGTAELPGAYVLARTSYWDATHALLYLAVPFAGAQQPAQVLVFRRTLPPLPAPSCNNAAPACAEPYSLAVTMSILIGACVGSLLLGIGVGRWACCCVRRKDEHAAGGGDFYSRLGVQ